MVLNLDFYFEMEDISYTLGCKTYEHNTSFLNASRKSQNSSHLEGNVITVPTVLDKDNSNIYIRVLYLREWTILCWSLWVL